MLNFLKGIIGSEKKDATFEEQLISSWSDLYVVVLKTGSGLVVNLCMGTSSDDVADEYEKLYPNTKIAVNPIAWTEAYRKKFDL